MFGKNSYQNYFNDPQFSSPPTLQYSRPNTSSVFDLNENEIVLHQHNHDLFSGHYLAANNAPIIDTDALNRKVEVLHGYPTSINLGLQNQTVAKKDRHSKINTSQGPRDRRIRLSIGIARKFFDLQELLGFNKPSKTLDWLLSKSEEAIKELVLKSNAANSLSSTPSEGEEVLSHENSLGPAADLKGKSRAGNKYCRDSVNLMKESRAKARARARDRTKEKMCIRQHNEVTRSNCVHASGSRDEVGIHFPVTYYGGTDNDLIQEIKRKLQQQPINSVYGGFPRDLSSSATPSGNANENWDYGNFIAQSNQLCAILDQHKIIN